MKKIILIISVLISLAVIYSCQDTLGIDNTKYLQSALIDTLSHDTLIVDYKKIIITQYLIKHDTVIKYDTVPVIRIPVSAKYSNVSIVELFVDKNNKTTKVPLFATYSTLKTASLDYNNYLPVLNLNLEINNDDISFNNNPLRNELLAQLSLILNKMQIISDMPQYLNVLYNEGSANLDLTYKKRDSTNGRIDQNDIYGTIFFYNRQVVKGQISSMTMGLRVIIQSLYNASTGTYGLELLVNFTFPVY